MTFRTALATAGMLHGFISSVDGRAAVRDAIALDTKAPEASGAALAGHLRSRGGDRILSGLNRVERVPSPQPE